MSRYAWMFHRYRQEKIPTPAREQRLLESLASLFPDGTGSRLLLRHLPVPGRAAESRVIAQAIAVPAKLGKPPPRNLLQSWKPMMLAISAAALLLAVLLARFPAGDPASVVTHLGAEESGSLMLDHVSLQFENGIGELSGTAEAPSIYWTQGRLRVDVDPHQGVELSIHTREADITVLGTRFTVERSSLETRVDVERGKVQVNCAGGSSWALSRGQSIACLPTSVSRLLYRADILREKNAPPQVILVTIDLGLEKASEGDLAWCNLQLLKMLTLADLGRRAEAQELALDYLRQGFQRRRLEVLRFARGFADEWCPLALEYRQTLSGPGATAQDILSVSDCMKESDPEGARQFLSHALQSTLPDKERTFVEQKYMELAVEGASRSRPD